MSEPFIGEIRMLGFNFAPKGWALCDGQLLPISSNTALFSLLGTAFGGDGRTTFGLPDLRGRVPINALGGPGPSLSPYIIGQMGGMEYVVLNQLQMPTHSHAAASTFTGQAPSSSPTVDLFNAGNATTPSPSGAKSLATFQGSGVIYSSAAPESGVGPQASVAVPAPKGTVATTVGNTGGNQLHENRMPFLAINFSIALQGLYPSRN